MILDFQEKQMGILKTKIEDIYLFFNHFYYLFLEVKWTLNLKLSYIPVIPLCLNLVQKEGVKRNETLLSV